MTGRKTVREGVAAILAIAVVEIIVKKEGEKEIAGIAEIAERTRRERVGEKEKIQRAG